MLRGQLGACYPHTHNWLASMKTSRRCWKICVDDRIWRWQILNYFHNKRLWRAVTKYLHDTSGLMITMSDADILSSMRGSGNIDLLNLVYVIVKQYLYACKCNNLYPTISTLLIKIKDLCENEKSIFRFHVRCVHVYMCTCMFIDLGMHVCIQIKAC